MRFCDIWNSPDPFNWNKYNYLLVALLSHIKHKNYKIQTEDSFLGT